MGAPRKDVIGGWFGGKPKLSGWFPISEIRSGLGSAMSNPRTPRPVGRNSWSLLLLRTESPTVMNSERACFSSSSTPSAGVARAGHGPRLSATWRRTSGSSRFDSISSVASSTRRSLDGILDRTERHMTESTYAPSSAVRGE